MNLPRTSNRVLFRWHFNWKICLFSALMLPVLISLGFWQLQRAEHKRTLAQTIEREQARPAVDFSTYHQQAELSGFSYRAVSVTGSFDEKRYWLLENKIHNGRPGFEVVMVFMPRSGPALLVNRGWVASSGYRDRLPDIDTPSGEQTLIGWMTTPSQNPLIDETGRKHSQWPRLTLEADPARFGAELGLPVWPQWLKLRAESAAALTIDWQPLNMTATRHIGYAVQWFSMAATLVLLTLIVSSNLIQWVRQRNE